MLLNEILILIGKIISKISYTLNLGSGSTWPGHIALETNKNFIKDVIKKNKNLKIVLIAGTNGKTTTGKLIKTILEQNGQKVFQNQAGANLLNGIASTLVLHSTIVSALNYDYAIFEIDENTLPLVLNELSPDYLILLNLFRDQLDRYGEVNTISNKWQKAINNLPDKTILILNADDPQISYLGNSLKTKKVFFGFDQVHSRSGFESTDSTYCPNCNSKLHYENVNFSHLGKWECKSCKLKRPEINLSKVKYNFLPGLYNKYNLLAGMLFAKVNNIDDKIIEQSLSSFKPAFGRQEEIDINGKKVKIFLSKNPTSFNESLRTINELEAKNLLIVLNDRIPDGHDVSWIWDIDIESHIKKFKNITVSGDRCFDMGLRIKYSFNEIQNYNSKVKISEDLNQAIKKSLESITKNETLYILPTYSAMLEVRKILTGKKIL